MWLNQYAQQFLPIGALLVLRGVVGAVQWVASKLSKEKKDPMQEVADELGAHRAKEFNLTGGGRGSTGAPPLPPPPSIPPARPVRNRMVDSRVAGCCAAVKRHRHLLRGSKPWAQGRH